MAYQFISTPDEHAFEAYMSEHGVALQSVHWAAVKSNWQRRLFALEEGDGNLLRGHGRACALLMAAEGHGFEDVLLYYEHLMEHLKWKDLGHVLAGGGGVEGKPELEQAYGLGRSI